MSFARRTAAVVQQCSRKQPRQPSSRRRSDESENEPPRQHTQVSRPSLTTFEDRVTSVTQELVGAYAQRTTQLEAEIGGLRADLERRKINEA